jgi:putative ABC transport system permease protein
LEKSHAPIIFLFAMKQLLKNKKQAIALSLIITGLTFASAFGITVYYYINSDAFRQSVILDDVDITLIINDSTQSFTFKERVLALPEVETIYGRDEITLNINEIKMEVAIIEDFANVKLNLVDGRFPFHDNEILLGGTAMHKMGISLGDWVAISLDESKEMYLITGIVQTQQNEGLVAVFNIDGIRVIKPDFTFSSFAIVLAQGSDGYFLVDNLLESEGSIITEIYYIQPFLEIQLAVLGNIYTTISLVLLSTIIIIVTLVLYLVVKTTILRKRRELGIQKAFGFTNFQLMNQIALNLFPSTLLGIIAGVIIGILSFNPIYVALLRDFGIVYSNLFIPITWTIMLCVFLVLLTYAVSMLVARRIRKISAYMLVTEQ